MGQGLSVHVNDQSNYYMCKVDLKPWSFWNKHRSKSFDVKGKKMEVFWDVSNAKYVCGPEPQEGFYVALLCEKEIVLLLGDMQPPRRRRACPPRFQYGSLSLADI